MPRAKSDLGIYTLPTLQSYKGKNRLEMPPHVYAIAEAAYYAMNAYSENQCVIISVRFSLSLESVCSPIALFSELTKTARSLAFFLGV